MPEVSLSGETSPVTRVELTLGMGSGPMLAVAVPPNHPWSLGKRVSVMALLGQRGELSWAGMTISFRFTGMRSATDRGDALVGVVLSDEVLGWFERVRSDSPSTHMLIYQRQESDPNGWGFVRRAMGDRVSTPHGADGLDAWFPVGSCILRSGKCDNLSHLNRVLALLATLPTRACGWSAFDAEDGQEPLRVIALDASPLALDSGWAPSGATQAQLPHRVAGAGGKGTLHRGFGLLAPDDAAQLLRELTRAGVPNAGSGLVGDPAQLPCLPGQVTVGGLVALCRRIRYDFNLPSSDEELQVEFNVALDFEPLPSSAGLTACAYTSSGAFVEWDEPSGKTRLAVSPGGAAWTMMGDGDSPDVETPDAEKPLVCHALTPFASRGEFSGFYVSHRKGDAMVVEVRDGEVPRMIGHHQAFAAGLEVPDLVLNTPALTLSGLPNGANLPTADGLALKGPEGTVEVFAKTHVMLKQKVTVTDEKTVADHNAEITGTLDVTKKTTLHDELGVTKKTTLKDELAAAKKATLDDELQVAKNATFNADVKVDGRGDIDKGLRVAQSFDLKA